MKEECKHENKAYNPVSMTLTSLPAIHIQKWICKDCGFEGEDRARDSYSNEYEETRSRFNKTGNYTEIPINYTSTPQTYTFKI